MKKLILLNISILNILMVTGQTNTNPWSIDLKAIHVIDK